MRAAFICVVQTGGFSVCEGVEIAGLHAQLFSSRSVEFVKYQKHTSGSNLSAIPFSDAFKRVIKGDL